MSGLTDRHWRERAAIRYLDALDAADWDEVAALWEWAGSDPELERLLRDLDEGLFEDEGPGADFAADAARVLELARRHLPGAFPLEVPAGPPTVAVVARRLEAEPEFGRFDPADRRVHDHLLGDTTPLPDQLALPKFERWAKGLGVTASPHYWRAFRKVAVLLDMARCQQEGRLAAARRATPPGPKGGTP